VTRLVSFSALSFLMLFSSPFPSSYSYYILIPHPILYQILRDLHIEAVSRAPNHNPDSVPILPSFKMRNISLKPMMLKGEVFVCRTPYI